MSHLDTFIHGPFDFALIRGRKSRDRISQDDWDILGCHTSMFNNPLPRFDVPTHSIHVDRGVHVTYHDKALCDLLFSRHHERPILQAIDCGRAVAFIQYMPAKPIKHGIKEDMINMHS